MQPTADLAGNVLSNLLANLICVGVPIAVATALYWRRGRRSLRLFFGISGGHTTVQIRLSNLFVKPSGTLGPLRIGTGFVGPAIIAAEYEHALDLVGAIQSGPLIGALRTLAEPLGIKAIDPPVICRIDPSTDCVRPGEVHRPVDLATDNALVSEIWRTLNQHRSFVLVGSPVYNVLTHYVLHHCDDQSRVEFVESPEEPGHVASAIKIKNFHFRGVDHVFPRRVLDLGDGREVFEEYFVVQRIVNWKQTGTTVFICAGNSIAATAAALAKLANWRAYAKEFGTGPFTAVYVLRTTDRELVAVDMDGPAPLGVATRVWPPESP